MENHHAIKNGKPSICDKWNLEWRPGFQNDNLRHLEWLGFVGMLSVWNLQKYT